MTFIQTYTGHKFYPLDSQAEDVFIEDIAHALSNLCRFGGQCTRFYSVAEHSVLISRWIEKEQPDLPMIAQWGLLHDASEAYLVDVPRPIKRALTGYASVEYEVMSSILEHFKLARPEPQIVREADNRILFDEFEQNMRNPRDSDIPKGIEKLGVRLALWSPRDAERHFLDQFHRLNLKRMKDGTAQGGQWLDATVPVGGHPRHC